jgi:hypothetical protein
VSGVDNSNIAVIVGLKWSKESYEQTFLLGFSYISCSIEIPAEFDDYGGL